MLYVLIVENDNRNMFAYRYSVVGVFASVKDALNALASVDKTIYANAKIIECDKCENAMDTYKNGDFILYYNDLDEKVLDIVEYNDLTEFIIQSIDEPKKWAGYKNAETIAYLYTYEGKWYNDDDDTMTV